MWSSSSGFERLKVTMIFKAGGKEDMSDWFFPSRGHGETEGFSNPGLEMFKGEPIRAMAREICQNSLDAVKDDTQPVRLEFENIFVNPCTKFPGITSMREILDKCRLFWKDQNDVKTMSFINGAAKSIRDGGIFVLRVSDYNTTGLKGAFSKEKITPWKSLVQGNAFSVKSSDSAAGSYGIGKAAPFVVSKLQTVFYRTYDESGVRAAQGVTHLVSFEDRAMSKTGEDPIRRSTGYFGYGKENKPFTCIKQLDAINTRDEFGTDLFIPCFAFSAGKLDWKDEIIVEILDNFLYSIYSGKLEVKIDGTVLKKETLAMHINKLMPNTKHAAAFYEVIREDNEDAIEEVKQFYRLGFLRLRLLYKADMNKKILVVRNSGMKISEISGLPKGISYTGFLEIQGEKLNAFFRGMENPQHNKWEPKRHSNPNLAKQHKSTVENWVKEMIGQKIKEISGAELDIDVGEYFSGRERTDDAPIREDKQEKQENVIDSVKSINIIQAEPETKKFKVKDIGGESGVEAEKVPGIIDDKGSQIGHRHRSGEKRNAQPTGRRGFSEGQGPDKIYDGMREVYVTARIISKGKGINKMIFIAEDDIRAGELEVVTMGENGKPLQLMVKNVTGVSTKASAVNGHIKVQNIKAKEKNVLEFSIHGNRTYAMGVRAYGN